MAPQAALEHSLRVLRFNQDAEGWSWHFGAILFITDARIDLFVLRFSIAPNRCCGCRRKKPARGKILPKVALTLKCGCKLESYSKGEWQGALVDDAHCSTIHCSPCYLVHQAPVLS